MTRKKINNIDERLYETDIKKEFIFRNYDFFFRENTYLINEMKLNSKSIIDLIHFDFNKNNIIGFELKSERDTIRRLDNQLKTYISFCNIVYVVSHEKHLGKIQELLQDKKYYNNVGIITTTRDYNFTEIKKATYQKPVFDSFIRNLDTEELTLLSESKGVDISTTLNKKSLVEKLKPKVNYSDIYESLKNKILKYYITGNKCPHCNQEVSYHKTVGYTKNKYCLLCNQLIL